MQLRGSVGAYNDPTESEEGGESLKAGQPSLKNQTLH